MRCKQSVVLVLFPIILCLAISPGYGAAEEMKKVYTLSEAIEEAFVRNPDYRATMEAIEEAVQVKNQARTGFFPKLTTEYDYTRLRNNERNFGAVAVPVSQDNYSWTTSLSQPVFKGFELLSNYELAKLGVDFSEIEAERAKLELALAVKEFYFNILIADADVEAAEKDVAARKSNADVVRSFYKVGMKPINELLQAEVEWANAKQLLVSAQNEARRARSEFNKTLSRPVNAPVDVKLPDPLWEPIRGELDEYIERALQNRPEIKRINNELEQADQEIRLAKSKHYPEVSLVGQYIKEGDTPDVSGSNFHQARDARAMAVFTWTFWEWGKTRYAVKEKESAKKQLMDAKLKIEDEIRYQVREVLLALETAEKNIPTARKAIEQGEENLRVSEERYKAQVTTITEVLDAQSRLTRSRVSYSRALYNHNLAKAQLLAAMGEY